MGDRDWLWIVVLLVVGIVVWRKFAKAPPRPPHEDVPPETVTPAIPQSQSAANAPTRQVTRPARNRPPPSAPPAVPPKPAKTKKGWLRGKERKAWQEEQWEKKKKEREEEDEARRAAAKERAEEQKRKDEREKAKSMAAAEGRMAEQKAKASARAEQLSEGKAGETRRLEYIRQKIPARISRDMNRFLAGDFIGPEQSPLTYVGYHVGVVRGLREGDRRERLEVCFRVQIPKILYADYKHWGEPATTQRLNAMIKHIGHHSAMRSTQSRYARAVAEWDADREWLRRTLSAKADAFSARWSGM